MKYSEIRPQIKSGDIIAFSEGSWKSWREIKINVVRMFTRSTYSHVGIAWVVGERVFLLDAVKPRIRIFPLSLEGNFYHIPTKCAWSKETEEYALSKIGQPYSEWAAIKAFFKPLDVDNVQECAAYVISVLRREGLYLGDMSRPDTVIDHALDLGLPVRFIRGEQ